MGELARTYWFPLYAFARRRGNSVTEAQDLVQGFLTHLMESDGLASADRTKGKFRSFLLASFKNYLTNQWNKNRAIKRGGGKNILSLDVTDAESRYAVEPVDQRTPEVLFERRWALAVLEQVMARLREEYAERGKTAIFEALEEALLTSNAPGYAEAAQKLGMTAGAFKVAAHRLRARYRELLRDEIGQTVTDPGLIDGEIQELLSRL